MTWSSFVHLVNLLTNQKDFSFAPWNLFRLARHRQLHKPEFDEAAVKTRWTINPARLGDPIFSIHFAITLPDLYDNMCSNL